MDTVPDPDTTYSFSIGELDGWDEGLTHKQREECKDALRTKLRPECCCDDQPPWSVKTTAHSPEKATTRWLGSRFQGIAPRFFVSFDSPETRECCICNGCHWRSCNEYALYVHPAGEAHVAERWVIPVKLGKRTIRIPISLRVEWICAFPTAKKLTPRELHMREQSLHVVESARVTELGQFHEFLNSGGGGAQDASGR